MTSNIRMLYSYFLVLCDDQNRNLYKPTSRSAQGTLMLWVDIFTVQDALKYPPVDFKGPDKHKFEIRIVCWRSREVHYKGYRSLDLFATFFMDGAYDNRQSTDTHWLCRSGAGSWNYRVKIPVELPISTREEGRLRVQLWNRNIIRSNELIGEASVPLFNWLLLVYKRKTAPVFPFKEKNEALAKIRKGESIPDVDDDGDNDADGDGDDGDAPREYAGPEVDGADLEDADPSKPTMTAEVDPSDVPLTPSTGNDADGGALSEDAEPLLSRSNDKRSSSTAVMAKPLTPSNATTVPDEADEEAKKEEENSVLSSIKQFFGFGTEIADDGAWLPMTYMDRRANKLVKRGNLAISISIVPESEAKSRPVGTGREEPNNNPYLPPPVGRFMFSFSPLSMFCQLLTLIDPCVLMWLCCCCACVCFIGVFAFISIYLSGIESLISLFKGV